MGVVEIDLEGSGSLPKMAKPSSAVSQITTVLATKYLYNYFESKFACHY